MVLLVVCNVVTCNCFRVLAVNITIKDESDIVKLRLRPMEETEQRIPLSLYPIMPCSCTVGNHVGATQPGISTYEYFGSTSCCLGLGQIQRIQKYLGEYIECSFVSRENRLQYSQESKVSELCSSAPLLPYCAGQIL